MAVLFTSRKQIQCCKSNVYSLQVTHEALTTSNGTSFTFRAEYYQPEAAGWISLESATFTPDFDKVKEAMEGDDVIISDDDNYASTALHAPVASLIVIIYSAAVHLF